MRGEKNEMTCTVVIGNTIRDEGLAREIESAVEEGFHNCGGRWKIHIDEDVDTTDWTATIQGPEGPEAQVHKISFTGTCEKNAAFVRQAVMRLLQDSST